MRDRKIKIIKLKTHWKRERERERERDEKALSNVGMYQPNLVLVSTK
jgi:hypothetical protein